MRALLRAQQRRRGLPSSWRRCSSSGGSSGGGSSGPQPEPAALRRLLRTLDECRGAAEGYGPLSVEDSDDGCDWVRERTGGEAERVHVVVAAVQRDGTGGYRVKPGAAASGTTLWCVQSTKQVTVFTDAPRPDKYVRGRSEGAVLKRLGEALWQVSRREASAGGAEQPVDAAYDDDSLASAPAADRRRALLQWAFNVDAELGIQYGYTVAQRANEVGRWVRVTKRGRKSTVACSTARLRSVADGRRGEGGSSHGRWGVSVCAAKADTDVVVLHLPQQLMLVEHQHRQARQLTGKSGEVCWKKAVDTIVLRNNLTVLAVMSF
eukprot:TRINITY_DN11491_c0_g1_i1.p1 TRINITY_DN11491_c0_g1~~TRINITY_DN11491_c0_g1_i1.p1  ORF type:complete len:321 (+),score=100.45 TRINITY_DN11491_c0_g1_i1:60-1022(+)